MADGWCTITGHDDTTTVGQRPNARASRPALPAVLTRLVWLSFAASVAVADAYLWTGTGWAVPGLVTVDGLTVTMLIVVTFFAGIVQSDRGRGAVHQPSSSMGASTEESASRIVDRVFFTWCSCSVGSTNSCSEP